MPGPRRLVCLDLDGTITLVHGWERVARYRGRLAEFHEAQRRFWRGETDEGEHLARLLNLAAGMRLTEMDEVLAATPKLAHLKETVDTLHERGAIVALLTHNPEYVCRWYCERFGFDLFAGVGQRTRAGRFQRAGRMLVDKRQGLSLLLRATQVRARWASHTGDGGADAAVFPYVGTGIALNTHLPEVEEASDVVLRTRDARELLPHLERPARTHVRPIPPSIAASSGSFRCLWARGPRQVDP